MTEFHYIYNLKRNKMAKANTIRKTFSRETSVSVDIQADSKTIWGLLTNAENYPKWNSTVISIDGKIALGEKIQLKSYLDPKRVFKLTVKELESEKKLVWGDAMGKSEYSLIPSSNGQTKFTMVEKIGGPLFAKMVPSFDKFAHDLKTESEKLTK
jgi:uncharacterized protein YndB with AHSA1/START domain